MKKEQVEEIVRGASMNNFAACVYNGINMIAVCYLSYSSGQVRYVNLMNIKDRGLLILKRSLNDCGYFIAEAMVGIEVSRRSFELGPNWSEDFYKLVRAYNHKPETNSIVIRLVLPLAQN
jgi:hypothetical protein